MTNENVVTWSVRRHQQGLIIINTEMNAGTLRDPNEQKFAAGLSTFKRWGEPEDVADIAPFLPHRTAAG